MKYQKLIFFFFTALFLSVSAKAQREASNQNIRGWSQQDVITIPQNFIKSSDGIYEFSFHNNGLEYFFEVNIGIDCNIGFLLLIDTGSADTWVATGSRNTEDDEYPNFSCRGYGKSEYLKEESTSYTSLNQTTSVIYNGYVLEGFIGTESLSIETLMSNNFGWVQEGFKGSESSSWYTFMTNNVTFGAINKCPTVEGIDIICNDEIEGVLGLGNQPLSTFGGLTFFDQLVATGQIEDAFSLFICDDSSGKLILGGENESYAATPIQYYPMIGNTYYAVNANYLKFGNKVFQLDSVIFASGSRNITGSPSIFNTIMDAFPREVHASDIYPDFVLNIDGSEYILTSSEYLVSFVSKKKKLGFYPEEFPSEYGQVIKLGVAFFNKYYSVFDRANRRMGLAKSIQIQ